MLRDEEKHSSKSESTEAEDDSWKNLLKDLDEDEAPDVLLPLVVPQPVSVPSPPSTVAITVSPQASTISPPAYVQLSAYSNNNLSYEYPGENHDALEKRCSNCHCAETPSWRRGVSNELLCNACGLFQKLHGKSRPWYVDPKDGRIKVRRPPPPPRSACQQCGTLKTPMWRRGPKGESLCNACGLHVRQHVRFKPRDLSKPY